MSESQLSALLTSLKISNNNNDVIDIVTLAKGSNGQSGQHYGLACQKHFDITHPDHLKLNIPNSDNVAIHPNQWYQASVQYYNAKSNKTITNIINPNISDSLKMDVDNSINNNTNNNISNINIDDSLLESS